MYQETRKSLNKELNKAMIALDIEKARAILAKFDEKETALVPKSDFKLMEIMCRHVLESKAVEIEQTEKAFSWISDQIQRLNESREIEEQLDDYTYELFYHILESDDDLLMSEEDH